VIADESADVEMIATDLLGQAEPRPDQPCDFDFHFQKTG